MTQRAARSAAGEPSVELRLAPAGKAVVLLGVGSGDLSGRRFTIEGRRVQLVRFGRLSLAVAYGDLAEYGPEALAERRTDEHWLAIEARIHERAIERASALAPIVPAKLLTVYEDLDGLVASARVQYARWSRSLARLGNKQEFVVRAYRGPHLAPQGLQPYLMRTTAHAVRGAKPPAYEADAAIAAELQAWWAACARIAIGTRRLDATPARGELFASILLGASGAGEALAKLAEERSTAAALGLTYYVEGPRAPFSFV